MSDEFNELKFSESQISLGKKTDLRQKEKSFKSQKKEKPETSQINLQPKKRKKRKKYTDALELEESDSKEYIEEEEEEEDDGLSVEIKNSDNDEESSESQESQNKKRKLEEINPGPRWERTYKDNNNETNNNNNDARSASSSSAVIVNIDKPNKNNIQNNEYNSVINNNKEDSNLINKNKYDIQVYYVKSLPENVNANNNNNLKMFITNINNQNRSGSYNNFYQNALNNSTNQNLVSKQHTDNNLNIKFANNNNYINSKPQGNQNDQSNYFQQRPFLAKYQKLLITQRIDQLIDTRYREFKFDKSNERLYQVLYENLYNYLRIYLLRLIKISRIRNVSFQLYSNNQNGQILYKFRTYNSQISEDRKGINYTKSGNFDILFTSNYKKDMDLIDEYVELNNKKLKFEKLSSCKEKDEENDKVKGLETSIKITEGPFPTIKLLPGRRTKKKDNSFIKEVRKKIVQTQKKEDLIKQNSNTKNTLEAFMNETNFGNKNKGKINSLLDDNKLNNKMDISSRMSDNLSNMYSYTNNTYNQIKNEIDMNVYKYFDPTKNENIPRPQKRRINIKDFIFMIENSNEYIPSRMSLLNKTSLEFVKKK